MSAADQDLRLGLECAVINAVWRPVWRLPFVLIQQPAAVLADSGGRDPTKRRLIDSGRHHLEQLLISCGH